MPAPVLAQDEGSPTFQCWPPPSHGNNRDHVMKAPPRAQGPLWGGRISHGFPLRFPLCDSVAERRLLLKVGGRGLKLSTRPDRKIISTSIFSILIKFLSLSTNHPFSSRQKVFMLCPENRHEGS